MPVSHESGSFLHADLHLWPWQDGAVITCSVRFDHRMIFQHYFQALRKKGLFLQAGGDFNLWLSSVLRVTEQEFIQASKDIHKDLISVRDSPDDKPPPVRLGAGA